MSTPNRARARRKRRRARAQAERRAGDRRAALVAEMLAAGPAYAKGVSGWSDNSKSAGVRWNNSA